MTHWWLAACALVLAGGQPDEAFPKTPPSGYHQRAREAIEEVLSGGEFANLQPKSASRWRRFLASVEQWLDDARDWLAGLPPWLLRAITAWLILTLVAALAHMAYVLFTLLRGTARGGLRTADQSSRQGEWLEIGDLDFDAVYQEARRRLGAGDWLAATRYLYVAAILWLDRQGRIVFRASKTNRDYLRELQRHPEDQSRFGRLTERFEAAAYGGHAPSETDCQTLASIVEGLLHETAPGVAR